MKLFRQSYWLKSGAYVFMQRLSTLLFGFGAFFFLIRALPKDEFGAWALYLSISAIVEMAKNGLVQNGLVKYLAADEKGNDAQIITASLVLNLLLSLLVAIGIALLAPLMARLLNTPMLEGMLYWYILNLFLLIPFSQLSFIQQANFDFRGIFFSNIVRQGLFFVFVVALFFFSLPYQLEWLIIVQGVGILLGGIFSYFFAKKYVHLQSSISWPWVQRLFHYGKYVFGTNVSSMIMKSTDQLMLGALAGPVAVASFNVAARATNFVEVPSFTMASIVFPKSAAKGQKEGPAAIKRLYEKSVGAVHAVLLPVVLLVLFFPELIILIIAGKDYMDSALLLQVVVVYCLFIPFSRQFGTIMDSVGKPHLNFWLICLLALLNVILNYFLISAYGVMGAAFATLFTYFIGFIANQLILYRFYRISTFQVFKEMWSFYRQGYQFLLARFDNWHWIGRKQ